MLVLRCAVALMIMTLVGCGTDGEAPESAATEEAAEGFDRQRCREQVGPLLSELEDLNSRLSIGLNLENYGTRVGDVRVAYDRLDVSEFEPGCLTEVAVPLESALDEYIDALNIWNECLDDIDCTQDDIRERLQERWADATEEIRDAQDALKD